MYFDNKPCAVCGSQVELRSRTAPPVGEGAGTVGQADGVVGDADSTVERVCSNSDCPTHRSGENAPSP